MKFFDVISHMFFGKKLASKFCESERYVNRSVKHQRIGKILLFQRPKKLINQSEKLSEKKKLPLGLNFDFIFLIFVSIRSFFLNCKLQSGACQLDQNNAMQPVTMIHTDFIFTYSLKTTTVNRSLFFCSPKNSKKSKKLSFFYPTGTFLPLFLRCGSDPKKRFLEGFLEFGFFLSH